MQKGFDYSSRIAPANIRALKPGEVFVFGANAKGMHYGGAARYALEHFGAKMGQGYGLQGQSFGIDTMSGLDAMKTDIDRFIAFAKQSDKTFLVTELGCGIAGYTPKDVAPLFKDAINVSNIYLPENFWKVLVGRAQSSKMP